MILYSNGIVQLDYDPATDILFMQWPDFHQFVLPEVKQSLDIILETIRNYDVKKLLIDSSGTVVDLSDSDYKPIMVKFVQNLMQTRLVKMARILSADITREERVNQVEQETKPRFVFRNFQTKEAALEWLTA
ncbi:hypothetical protein [Pontibacter sp. SGAir0037]|uniref:hypothetical protein n=1 Tax=Pontibacter sp. SGAir0037 TaxID=2571030 RepID=UPI0010CCFEC6|nr:hypothetical protein [Pontibacter sp. SGAir0037]QCR22868.1 hypothetical protein C1N53_11275 [Pontibacter sp. SGAir0037]